MTPSAHVAAGAVPALLSPPDPEIPAGECIAIHSLPGDKVRIGYFGADGRVVRFAELPATTLLAHLGRESKSDHLALLLAPIEKRTDKARAHATDTTHLDDVDRLAKALKRGVSSTCPTCRGGFLARAAEVLHGAKS